MGKGAKMATATCLSLHKSARIIGSLLFILTVGLFVAYLIFIEDLRRLVLENVFEIQPCTQPLIDIVVDSLFEYSLLVNLLLVSTCVGCTRWVLVPWLIVYSLNIILLVVAAIYLFINPLPMFTTEHAHYELLRLFGLVPIAVAFILGYFWAVVCNLFNSISSLEKKNDENGNGCCNLNYRIGVQIMAGILTIFSAVVLVLHYVKLDEMIKDKYERIFKEISPLWSQPSSWLPLQSTSWYSLAVPANGGDACSHCYWSSPMVDDHVLGRRKDLRSDCFRRRFCHQHYLDGRLDRSGRSRR